MIYGLDLLAAPRYAKLAVSETPEGWIVRTFTNIFGDGLPFVKEAAKRGKMLGIGLNLAWRDNHHFAPNEFPSIAREARRFSQVIKNHPHLKWYVSGATEHDLSRAPVSELFETVMAQLPSATIYVNQPWIGKGFLLSDYRAIDESHGINGPRLAGRHSFSCDGSDCFHMDIPAKKEEMGNAEFFMGWCSEFNGNQFGKPSKPRDKRTNWATAQIIRKVVSLIQNS